ncbi:hypothetical protein [Nocardioides sp.]|uniref:hypothetical protein n=1 Tax=Nocardioides sp. TaxID=35761 RepID=UPI003513CAF3
MAAHTGLPDPPPRLMVKVLRELVRARAAGEREGRSSTGIHVGVPGRRDVRAFRPGEQVLDAALRTEIVEAMARDDLAAGRVPLVWWARSAQADPGEDLAWSAAVAQASGELGVRLDLVVVTARSWHDPRSGVGCSWSRPLRRVSPSSGPGATDGRPAR